MEPKWENMGNCITLTKDVRDKSLKASKTNGVPLYFRVIDTSNHEISWKGCKLGQFTIHMVWATSKATIIDEIPKELVEYFKNLYNITNSNGKSLVIQTQAFPTNVDLTSAPKFNPTSISYI